jgi:hypothetical protein
LDHFFSTPSPARPSFHSRALAQSLLPRLPLQDTNDWWDRRVRVGSLLSARTGETELVVFPAGHSQQTTRVARASLDPIPSGRSPSLRLYKKGGGHRGHPIHSMLVSHLGWSHAPPPSIQERESHERERVSLSVRNDEGACPWRAWPDLGVTPRTAGVKRWRAVGWSNRRSSTLVGHHYHGISVHRWQRTLHRGILVRTLFL